MLLAGWVASAACTEAPGSTSTSSSAGSGASATTASSTSGGGSTSGTTGGTTTGPLPLAVFGTIPGDSFSPMSALSGQTPDSGGVQATAVVISDLGDACATLSSDAGMPSRALLLVVGVAFPDGGIGPPTAPGTFTVADDFASSGLAPGPAGTINYQNYLDGGCTAWLSTGGSIQLTSLIPVEGTFNVTLESDFGEKPVDTQLTGSFTATACPSLDFSLLNRSD